MIKPKVYLETTFFSYLTAWPSRYIITAANQEMTCEWWMRFRNEFDVFVSQIVIKESSAGDSAAVRRRMEIVTQLPSLNVTDEVENLAANLMLKIPLPPNAQADSLHIAIAAVNGMDYLLTWNCTHIANATLRSKIETICRLAGYEPPVICTPQEMLVQGENHE